MIRRIIAALFLSALLTGSANASPSCATGFISHKCAKEGLETARKHRAKAKKPAQEKKATDFGSQRRNARNPGPVSGDDHRYPYAGASAGPLYAHPGTVAGSPRRAARRSQGAPARSYGTTSRACLPGSITAKLNSLEARYGRFKIIATKASRPRIATGPSYHESCRAVDFTVPRGKYGAVSADLRATWGGGLITYSGCLHHIHLDAGPKIRAHKHVQCRAGYDESPDPAPVLTVEPKPVPALESYRLASIDPGQIINELDEATPIRGPPPSDIEIAEARQYLKRVATAGGTMMRQGVDAVMTRIKSTFEQRDIFSAFREATARGEVRDEGIAISIDRLHPDYALKLAATVKEARANGLPEARPFSCYRPPAYRVGGMRDKSESCHAYGLVCDMTGIGWARSKDAKKWASIASRGGLHRPHRSAREFNHWQLVPNKVCGTAAMRATITGDGPKSLESMWAAGTRLGSQVYVTAAKKTKKKRRVRMAAR